MLKRAAVSVLLAAVGCGAGGGGGYDAPDGGDADVGPQGPPRIEQVFVLARENTPAPPRTRLQLAFGLKGS